MGRILAIDYGTKRLGVSLSDETKTIAIPKPYIATSQKEKLLDLIKENYVEEILLGLPKSLSGEETKSAKAVRKFESWLARNTNLPIKLIDERLTTKEVLRETKNKNLVDSLVAQRMLARYLDQNF